MNYVKDKRFMLGKAKCKKCVTITMHRKDTDEYKMPYIQCLTCSVITWLPKEPKDSILERGIAYY